MASLLPYVLVASGGALGALARFVLSRWVGALVETRFPMGTFVVNVSGSFLLGVIGTLVADRVVPNADAVRPALGIGFLGAFTTFWVPRAGPASVSTGGGHVWRQQWANRHVRGA